MNPDDVGDRKPEVTYPCRWEYRLIGRDESLLRQAAALSLAGIEHTIVPAHQSGTGKYCSISIEATVGDEAQRLSIYEALRGCRDIIMIL